MSVPSYLINILLISTTNPDRSTSESNQWVVNSSRSASKQKRTRKSKESPINHKTPIISIASHINNPVPYTNPHQPSPSQSPSQSQSHPQVRKYGEKKEGEGRRSNSRIPRILLLIQNPLGNQLLRPRPTLHLLIEMVGQHMLFQFAGVGL